jgi:iron uptake system component EfeO
MVDAAAVEAVGPLGVAAVDGYRNYFTTQVAALVARTSALLDAIRAGDVATARVAYARARIPWERIEPVAAALGPFAVQIDALEGQISPSQWTGFHRIEKALFGGRQVDERATAAQLLTDVSTVRDLEDVIELTPGTIAEFAVDRAQAAEEASRGREERYSDLDLTIANADLEGARAAYDLVKPLAGPKDRASIDRAFAGVDQRLAKYRTGDEFVAFGQIPKTQRKALAKAMATVAGALGDLPTTVVKSGL